MQNQCTEIFLWIRIRMEIWGKKARGISGVQRCQKTDRTRKCLVTHGSSSVEAERTWGFHLGTSFHELTNPDEAPLRYRMIPWAIKGLTFERQILTSVTLAKSNRNIAIRYSFLGCLFLEGGGNAERCSGIRSGFAQGPYEMLEIQPGLAKFRANILRILHSLVSHFLILIK